MILHLSFNQCLNLVSNLAALNPLFLRLSKIDVVLVDVFSWFAGEKQANDYFCF